MRIQKFAVAAASLALVGVLTACSDEDPGGSDDGQTPILPPGTSAPGSAAPGQPLPHSGAPKVASPIADTSQWEADPCRTITVEQLNGVGLQASTPQRDDPPGSGPGCLWEMSGDALIAVSDSFATTDPREGLSTIYKNNAGGNYKVFEEVEPIEGHPAVIAEVDDYRSEGDCGVAVGLRDDLVLTVSMQAEPTTPQGKDPCGWAAKVAALALQTMKGSS